MIILIDAYNLSKHVLRKPHLTEQEIKRFLLVLKKYADIKKVKLIIIFDGGEFQFTSRRNYNGLDVLYSGYKQTADHVLKDLMQEYVHQDVILISSDRELRDFAKNISVESLSSLEFWVKVKEATTAIAKKQRQVDDNQIYKMIDQKDQQLDDLMMAYSTKVPRKHEEDIERRGSKAITESKKEKKLGSILKKL